MKFNVLIKTYISLSAFLLTTFADNQFRHPLDTLTNYEIAETVEIIRAFKPSMQLSNPWAFNLITLKEPEKRLILPYFLNGTTPPFNSDEIPRQSFTILVDKKQNIVNEVVVNLKTKQIISWNTQPHGTQTAWSAEDSDDCEIIAKDDFQVQKRCKEMGWGNMSLVVGECWGLGYGKDRPALNNAIRPLQVYFFGKMFDYDNHYAHPFDFVVTVDMALRRVISIDNLPTHSDYNADNTVGNVCPKLISNYDPSLNSHSFYRADVHPIRFSQPEGASYQVKGNEVTWQKFKFRVGFNWREGLFINQVTYQDGKELRPLFYRMSVGELYVPYGDPRPPFHEKIAFDMGEWGMGILAIDLKESNMCGGGGVVSYLSYHLNNEKGESNLLPNVVCIYEEDAGILWAHETVDNKVFHTRSQRLVVTAFTNMGNYDYKTTWRFYQDASIEFLTDLHGALSSQLLAVNVTNAGGFGIPVNPQINGQFHQHHIAMRLDTEIDGNANVVSTVDIEPLPQPTGSNENPYGNGFTTRETVLRTPVEARTKISPLTGRSWFIRNSGKLHPYTGKPVSWKLAPFNAPPVLLRKDSPMHHRAAFTDYNVWVTKYKEDQLYPGGFYENGTGLPEWVEKDPNADITNTDIVLWYIYGFTHIPRVEDYPIMPVESAGFVLKPTNFFLASPALDVPIVAT